MITLKTRTLPFRKSLLTLALCLPLAAPTPGIAQNLPLPAPGSVSSPATGVENPRRPFLGDPDVESFMDDMVAQQGFDRPSLERLFGAISPNERVLQAIIPGATPEQRSWQRYRSRFVEPRHVEWGLAFWYANGRALRKANQDYGVPEEIIAAIIGVETGYGRNTGGFSVFQALSTLAFRYPPRAPFFRKELEQFLLLTRENRLAPLGVKGSYAGAIGIPQFMPGSLRSFAVDFDGDGRIDLSNDEDDAIGSVAAFLAAHGWQPGRPIAAHLGQDLEIPAAWMQAGIKPTLPLSDIAAYGFPTPPQYKESALAAIVDLVTPGASTEYWLGFDNFFVITRYNRSAFYAMSVFQLAEALRTAHDRGEIGTVAHPARRAKALPRPESKVKAKAKAKSGSPGKRHPA